ncbi:MAG: TonB-dependent receptor [Bacteroidales bacterium]|nr:TonB-dependent receptor [Candidatus Liminaster caballi]
MARKAFSTLVLGMLCVVALAQTQTVAGVVTDDFGDPMIGVNVSVKGTTNGSITDFDGNYVLHDVKASDVLVFSYIGYTSKEAAVGNQSKIDMQMVEDQVTLEDVVVVGYGTMKKSDLTGSVSSVSTDKLNAKGAPSVMANLQGSVPGVNITQSSGRAGGGFAIEIRGKSSTNSDTHPIYVIDGVICDDMDFLNPQDIERIDVLKDASSTAIYGSRATAGVVMITTKSGSGVNKQESKASISYDGYYGITNVARMPDFMDGQEFYNYRFLKFLTYAEGGAANARSGQPTYQMGTFQQMGLWKSDDSEAGGYSVLKQRLKAGETYDWPDAVTSNGYQQNHYLAVSGTAGGGDVSYHMGLGYNSEQGIYEDDKQSRINFKGSVDAKISKYVTGGFNFNLARQENDYADDNAVQYAYRMNPFMVPYNADGVRNEKPGNYEAMGSDNGFQFSDQPNPLLLFENQTKNKQTWRMLGNVYLQIKPMDGLSLKTTFAPSFSTYREGTFNDESAYVKGYEPDGDGSRAVNTQHRSFNWTWTNQVNYSKSFKGGHNADILALNEVTAGNSEKLSVTSRRVLPGSLWYNVGSASDKTTGDYSSSYSESSMISWALRANYSYKGRYMLTGTVRWDGSSKFADGHRWGSFPSVAAAWRISDESFMANTSDWLSNLKLRLSYGVTGNNDGIGNYATQQTVATGHYYPFGGYHYTGAWPNGVVDRNLTWESSTEYNAGFDFGFLNNRITGTLDVYNKEAVDLLYPVKLPLEAGLVNGAVKEMKTNVGTVQNRGVEVSLTTVNIDGRNWHWTTTFNFSANKNKVKEINGTGMDMPGDNLFIGRPINNVYTFIWDGIVSDREMTVPNKPIATEHGFTPGQKVRQCDYYYECYGWTEGNAIIRDVNGDGKFNDEDKKVYSSDPKWTGSFTSNLSYKQWDLSVSVYAKQKFTVSSNFYDEYLNWGDRGRNHLQVDYYIPAGTLIDCDGVNADGTYINPVYQKQTHYGSYPFPNNGAANGGVGSSQWTSDTNKLTDASFVKVKNITLGYTFSKKVLNHIGLSKLRLYATVTNPFVFTDYKGFDPEWAGATNKQDGPSTITWQFGASVKF